MYQVIGYGYGTSDTLISIQSAGRAFDSAAAGLGLLQTEVAERLNKPQSFVSKYENVGRRLDVIELIAVLKALEMTPYEFFDLVFIENR